MTILEKILDGLSAPQKDAVTSKSRATRVVACAGAGKTETMARRVVRTIHDGTPPEEIVAFTFTERAAREMKARILRRAGEILGGEVRDRLGRLSVGTIHAFCFRLLQERGGLGHFDLLDEHQERAFLARHGWALGLDELGEKLLGEHLPYPRCLELFRRSVSVVYSEIVDRGDLRAASPRFAAYLEAYERLLEDHRLLTFDQVVARAVELLRRNPASRPALKHLLVDEYQDVNRAQEALVVLLAKGGASVFVVGDPAQCIYEWRGSDVGCFDAFTKRFPGTQTITLAENRRSREEIVKAANLYGAAMAPGWTRMTAIRSDGAKAVWFNEHDDAPSEAAAVVAKIRHEWKSGRPLREMAILLGSVDTAGGEYIDRLRAAGVPFEIGGRSGLFRHDTAQGLGRLFAWFADHRWSEDPWDRSQDIAGDDLLESALEDKLGLDGKPLAGAHREMERLKEAAREGKFKNFTELYFEVLRAVGVLALDPDRPEDAHLLAIEGRFNQLLNDYEAMIRRVSADPVRGRGSRNLNWPTALTGFAWYLTGYATDAYEETDGDQASSTDAVRITTIHQAKGLEWPIVFLPALLSRRFPTKARGSRDPWLLDTAVFDAARYEGDEGARRRVLYVALTRARDALLVSWFTQGRGKRSRFLDAVEAGMSPPAASTATPVPPDPKRRAAEAELEAYAPTELILWRRCPYRYRLSQVWGFQAGLAPEMGYGRASHHVLRRVAERARDGAKVTAALVGRELEAGFYPPYAPAGMREDMKAAASKQLLAYVVANAADLPRTVEAESRLEFPLNGSIIQGSVDVILAEEGGLEVRDYKTAEDDHQEGESEFQVRLYGAGIRRTVKKLARATVANLYKGVREVGTSPAELEAAEREAEDIIQSIQAGRFPARPGPACAGCDFARICRFAGR